MQTFTLTHPDATRFVFEIPLNEAAPCTIRIISIDAGQVITCKVSLEDARQTWRNCKATGFTKAA